jgi:hypothetical protein
MDIGSIILTTQDVEALLRELAAHIYEEEHKKQYASLSALALASKAEAAARKYRDALRWAYQYVPQEEHA